jgi:hypothetical protein
MITRTQKDREKNKCFIVNKYRHLLVDGKENKM